MESESNILLMAEVCAYGVICCGGISASAMFS